MSKILVNAVGDACPIPVTKTIHALSGMTEAGTVEVHVDNETAVQNLNRLATGKGLKFSAEKREEKLFVVTLTVDDPAPVIRGAGGLLRSGAGHGGGVVHRQGHHE